MVRNELDRLLAGAVELGLATLDDGKVSSAADPPPSSRPLMEVSGSLRASRNARRIRSRAAPSAGPGEPDADRRA